MTKHEYLTQLKNELQKNNIADADDIVVEYEQHFAFKLADGFSEEEIAAKLGAPASIAAQFESTRGGDKRPSGSKMILKIGLAFVAVFEAILYLLFLLWSVALAVVTVALFALGVLLVAHLNVLGVIPNMPYLSSLLFGVAILALALLCACATYYCFAYTNQLARASARWHKNMLSGNPLPPLPWSPQFESKPKRRLRALTNWSLILSGVTSVLAIVVSQILSGALGFWHAWNWFVK